MSTNDNDGSPQSLAIDSAQVSRSPFPSFVYNEELLSLQSPADSNEFDYFGEAISVPHQPAASSEGDTRSMLSSGSGHSGGGTSVSHQPAASSEGDTRSMLSSGSGHSGGGTSVSRQPAASSEGDTRSMLSSGSGHSGGGTSVSRQPAASSEGDTRPTLSTRSSYFDNVPSVYRNNIFRSDDNGNLITRKTKGSSILTPSFLDTTSTWFDAAAAASSNSIDLNASSAWSNTAAPTLSNSTWPNAAAPTSSNSTDFDASIYVPDIVILPLPYPRFASNFTATDQSELTTSNLREPLHQLINKSINENILNAYTHLIAKQLNLNKYISNNSLILEKLKLQDWPETIVAQSNIINLFSGKYAASDSYSSHLATFKHIIASACDSLLSTTIEALKSEIDHYKEILNKFKARLLTPVYALICDYITRSLQKKNKQHLADSDSFCDSCNSAANHAVHIMLISLFETRLSATKTTINKSDEITNYTKRVGFAPPSASSKPTSSVSFQNAPTKDSSKRGRSKSPVNNYSSTSRYQPPTRSRSPGNNSSSTSRSQPSTSKNNNQSDNQPLNSHRRSY
jgi:hypothetical protein